MKLSSNSLSSSTACRFGYTKYVCAAYRGHRDKRHCANPHTPRIEGDTLDHRRFREGDKHHYSNHSYRKN
jgi:hypothetical protein